MDRDYWSLISPATHRQMLSDSRQIARMPMVRGATRQKAQYVCGGGLRPYYAGRNAKFGQMAEEWLEQWFKICNVRGRLYNWDQTWFVGCQSLDVDVDFFVLLTESESGWPRIQCFDAHQVHSRPGQMVVKSGLFAGRPIISGIVYGDQAEELGYQVLGPTEAEDRIFSSDDMIRVSDPGWFTEGRGLSPVSYGLHEWYAYRDCQDNELLAQTITSSLVLLEKNDAGQDPDLSRRLGSAAGLEPEVTDMDGGLFRYIKNSDSLEAFMSSRPAPESQAFLKEVASSAIFGMEWRREMFSLADLGGTGIKGFADNINTVIHWRHGVIVNPASSIVGWAIAKAIKRGDLPEDADWWMWDFPLPPSFTPDAGRTMQAIETALRLGVECEDDVVQMTKGTTWKRMMRRRAMGKVIQRQTAEEFGLSVEELGRTDMPGDAKSAQANAAKSATKTGEQPPPSTKTTTQAPMPTDVSTLIEDYGVAVRAGLITPNRADEEHIRKAMGFPAPGSDVDQAWEQDGRSRKPITLQGQKQAITESAAAANIDPDQS
jgi:hypothetical protein